VGRLGICAPYTPPVLADDVRKALVASADLAAILRLEKRGWKVSTNGRSTTGRRGPAFSAKART
jgi:hypothetical protein